MEDNNKDYSRFMPKEMREEHEREAREEMTEILEASEGSEEPETQEEPEKPERTERPYEQEDPEGQDESEGQDELSAPFRLPAVAEWAMRIVYWLLNPYLIATYATILIFELSVVAISSPAAAPIYSVTCFGITVILPLIVLRFLRRFRLIGDYTLRERDERTLPYVVSLVTLGVLVWFMMSHGAEPWLWTIYVGGCATILINLFVNYRIRVSNHASGVAALLAMFIALQRSGMILFPLGWWVIGTVVVLGVVGTAAMALGRHRFVDVVVGYLTGFLPIILISLIR